MAPPLAGLKLGRTHRQRSHSSDPDRAVLPRSRGASGDDRARLYGDGVGCGRMPQTGWVHQVKRFVMTILGFGLLGVGALMVVLPGPGLLFVVAGLAVLATEYVWARRLLVRAKKEAKRVQDAAVASRLRTAGSATFAGVLVGFGLFMVIIRRGVVAVLRNSAGPGVGSRDWQPVDADWCRVAYHHRRYEDDGQRRADDAPAQSSVALQAGPPACSSAWTHGLDPVCARQILTLRGHLHQPVTRTEEEKGP